MLTFFLLFFWWVDGSDLFSYILNFVVNKICSVTLGVLFFWIDPYVIVTVSLFHILLHSKQTLSARSERSLDKPNTSIVQTNSYPWGTRLSFHGTNLYIDGVTWPMVQFDRLWEVVRYKAIHFIDCPIPDVTWKLTWSPQPTHETQS